MVRWLLHKSPDGDVTVTELNTSFNNTNDSQAQRELRKNTIAKGQIFVNSNNQSAPMNIFISRKALARISPMREGDLLRLVIAKDAAGTTGLFSMFGNMYIRANG